MPSSAEEEGAGHSAGKGSREESEMPALEASADPDTASEPSWGYAASKDSRKLQNGKGDAERPWKPKAGKDDAGRPEGSMGLGESFVNRRFYRADSQKSMTDAEHDAWRRNQREEAKRAAAELAASLLAIRPEGAKRAANACRMAAAAAG